MNLDDRPIPLTALLWLIAAIVWCVVAVLDFHPLYLVAAILSVLAGIACIFKFRRKNDRK